MKARKTEGVKPSVKMSKQLVNICNNEYENYKIWQRKQMIKKTRKTTVFFSNTTSLSNVSQWREWKGVYIERIQGKSSENARANSQCQNFNFLWRTKNIQRLSINWNWLMNIVIWSWTPPSLFYKWIRVRRGHTSGDCTIKVVGKKMTKVWY